MAITLSDIRTRARQRADMENSTFVSDTEANIYINDAYKELYGLLVEKFQDYFVADPVEFTIASGSDTYTVDAAFYKLVGVDSQISSNHWYALKPWMWTERNRKSLADRMRGNYSVVRYRLVNRKLRFSPTTKASGTYRYWYIPTLTALSGDSDEIDTTIEQTGWYDYITIDAAIKMLAKEESDTRVLMKQKADLVERIESEAQNRDLSHPDRVQDVRNLDFDDPYIPRF